MIYVIKLIGGPLDGQEILGPKPQDALKFSDGHVYAAEHQGDECLIWDGDDSRIIELKHLGHGAEFPPSDSSRLASRGNNDQL